MVIKRSVIPIAGIAGLRKTTLAKLVLKNEEVAGHFHLKIWVSVSDDFDIKQLLVKLIKSITNENCSDLDVEQLQMRLWGHLHNRKFLLFLDDV